jgi:hypothetical protein
MMPVALTCSYFTQGMRIRLVLPALEDIVSQHRFVGIRTGELPVGVIFALPAALRGCKKHSRLIVSWPQRAYKRVSLHSIAWKSPIASTALAPPDALKIAVFYKSVTNFGLTAAS